MQSDTLETLFGGAAGGGKSHGQLLDALRFAVCYPGSRQLMLRRTMPELERSLVPAALRLYPQCIAKYIYITMKTTVCKAIFADFSIKSQKTDARLTKKQACFCISCQFLRNTAVGIVGLYN